MENHYLYEKSCLESLPQVEMASVEQFLLLLWEGICSGSLHKGIEPVSEEGEGGLRHIKPFEY